MTIRGQQVADQAWFGDCPSDPPSRTVPTSHDESGSDAFTITSDSL